MKKNYRSQIVGMMLITFAIFLGIGACKKETNLPNSNKNVSALSRTIPFSDWPTINNGMLYFRDDAHYLSYAQYLDTVVAFSEGNLDTALNDPDDILELVESGLGFTSLRHTSEATFAALNETGWSTLAEIPERHFLNSITTKSILNADADFRIGDTITHYISKDFAVTLPATEDVLLGQLHGLSTSATFEDIQQLDISGQLLDIIHLTNTGLSYGKIITRTPLSSTVNIWGGDVTYPDQCIYPTRVELSSFWTMPINTGGGALKADYHIEWGDGTFDNVSSAGVSTSPYFSPGRLHVYAALGTYSVHISCRVNAGTPNYSAPYDGQIYMNITVAAPCTPGESKKQGSVWHYDNLGMNRAYWGQVWVEQDVRPGHEKHKVGVKTESYHQENSKWKLSRIDHVVAQFSTTKYSNGCSINWGDNGADWANNSQTAYREHTNSSCMKWYRVWANHRIVVGSNTFSFDQEMVSCN